MGPRTGRSTDGRQQVVRPTQPDKLMSQRSTRDLLSEKITTAVGREEKLPDSDTYYTNTYMCTCIYMVKVDVIC